MSDMTARNPMTTAAPARAARWYWGLCAFVGLALTITVNGAHAKQVMPDPNTWTAVAVSVIPPIMFAALFEGYFLTRRVVPVKVLRAVLASVIVLGGASFAISYTAISYFIQRRHDDLPVWTAWVMPGLLDTFVGVSTYVVYVLSQHTTAPVPSTKTVRSSRWQRLADAATARAEAALTLPEKPLVEPVVEVRGGSVEHSAEAPVDDLVEPHKPSVEPSVEAPKTSAKTPMKPSVEPELARFMDAAEAMVTEGVIARKTPAEVARVIAAISDGMTDNGIKSAGIASASTAAKVRAAMTSDSRPLIAV